MNLSFPAEPESSQSTPYSQECTHPCVAVRQTSQADAVGAVLPEDIEAELDSAIRDLGRKAEAALAAGDAAGAREYADRMYAAIRSRTPEHQARLSAEVDRRIDESTFQGEWAMRLAGAIA